MPRLTGPDATMVLVAIAIVLLFAFAFSFRDTVRGMAEFFDVRALRRFRRRPWQATITIGGVATFFALLWMLVSGPDDSPLLFLGLAPLIVVPGIALAWLIISDISQGIGDRRRRNERKRKDK